MMLTRFETPAWIDLTGVPVPIASAMT